MSCESIRSWLGAYLDGELSPLRNWRCRLHLRRCAECAREVSALTRLDTLLHAADVVAVSAGSPVAHSGAGRSMPGRMRSLPRLRTALTILGVLAVAALAFVPHRTSYGDPLERAIETLMRAPAWKTSHLVVRSRDGRTVTEQWVALPHSLRAEIRRDGHLAEVTVQNEREAWIYRAEANLAVHSTVRPYVPEAYGVGAFHGPLNSLRRLRQSAARLGGVNVSERRVREADGRLLRVFTVAVDVARHYPGQVAPPGDGIRRDDLYLDAQTGRLVRWEDRETGNRYEVDAYDVSPPLGTFAWQVPSGVRLVEHRDWWKARAGKTLAVAENPFAEVTVHAVDLSAQGEVWLTVSKRSATGNDRITSWPARGMLMEDDRGRVYIHYQTRGMSSWPENVALLAFTPLRPLREGALPPRRVTVRLLPEHRPHTTPVDHTRELLLVRRLRAPSPSPWPEPPVSPLDLLVKPEARAGIAEEFRSRARRAYRADNPCGAFG